LDDTTNFDGGSPAGHGFLYHVRACNNAVLPGERLAFRIGASQVGWVLPAIAQAIEGHPAVETRADAVVLHDPSALSALVQTVVDRGLCCLRGEMFDVRAEPDGPALAQIDRGALPKFGIQAIGVHVNGLVDTPQGLHLWIARRARDKLLDPGKLDHIVAGGVPAGLDPWQTLVKEAGEEAAIPPDLATLAEPVGRIAYAMVRSEGLRRDALYCYDLKLPADFRPEPADGEVEAFELWPIARVADTVSRTDDFKFNVNLVLIDLFSRLGLIKGAEAARLRAGLQGGTLTGNPYRHGPA
jgi:8-oxo-dGTP pyrophosphatase MutT (NUDIX family)